MERSNNLPGARSSDGYGDLWFWVLLVACPPVPVKRSPRMSWLQIAITGKEGDIKTSYFWIPWLGYHYAALTSLVLGFAVLDASVA